MPSDDAAQALQLPHRAGLSAGDRALNRLPWLENAFAGPGAAEIRVYHSHLAVEQNVAASTQNVVSSALMFLYPGVLHLELPAIQQVERAQKMARLPEVFTREEAWAVLSHLEGVPALMARLHYGSGLRLLECVRLRVKDVDFYRLQPSVRAGKGERDRATMLPPW